MQRRTLLGTLATGVTVGWGGLSSSLSSSAAYRITRDDVSSRTPSPHSSSAIASSIHIRDDRVTAESAGSITVRVTNVSGTPQRIAAGHNGPFGLLSGDAIEGDGRFLLWTDYGHCVSFSGGTIAVCLSLVTQTLSPGESVARQYEILHRTTGIHPAFTQPPTMGAYRVVWGVPGGTGDTTPFFDVGFALEPLS